MLSYAALAVNIYFANAFFLDSFGGGHGGPGGGGPSGGSLFGGGGGMCAPIHTFCPLQCPNGYMKNDHGCPMCHCANPTTSNPLPASSHHIANPCIPTHARCSLNCEQFTKGAGGCEFCQCDNSQRSSSTTTSTSTTTTTTTTPTPVSMTSSPASSTIDTCAIAAQICDQRCNGEYLSDHKDCTFCVCKSDLG